MSIATMSPPATVTPPATRGSDFATLSGRIAAAGLTKRRPGYYVARISLVAGLYVAGWAAFVAVGDSWYQLLVAPFLAIVFAQLAFVSHDIAHRQVFRTRRPSEIAGLIAGNLGIGMSYGWWMDKHTRHHANPNHEERDPDVVPDVLVWSTRQAEASRGIPRLLGGWQAYLFFPLLTLEGLSLHVNSARALARPSLRHRWAESGLLVLHFAAYLAALLLVLSPAKALAFLAVQQGLFGVYLGSTFAPNHKGMEMPSEDDQEQWDFLRRQVLTSRNVRGGHFINVLLGGLNYQIEHHLFPSMPSVNLRRARPIVRDYCDEIGVAYTEAGLIGSYGQALRYLHEVGAPLRRGSEA
ncbi:fatty acid desaturase family protein [Rugosimonospora africana]|uniref:Delta fatty acid desaturase n=1 Tax=Rugosimonospora africana TaxID=556532 RepID=A0A8J3QW15_9ACTN|nr:acyl-CoA desaturase [Rugosimonospora africana]GIH17414.1 delta fatty acid desaturase [Rugosimonospora africana]